MDIIKSVSDNQEIILLSIIKLYCPQGFQLDPTYSKGVFYKGAVPQPLLKFDLIPQTPDTQHADCRHLPLADNSIASIIFDPPFLSRSGAGGIIKERFGYYPDMKSLWAFYAEALNEFYRLLQSQGYLIFKCQDSIAWGKQYLSHITIINSAIRIGFYPIDLFIQISKHRMPQWNLKHQEHARKYHNYFLVFKKIKSPVSYEEFK